MELISYSFASVILITLVIIMYMYYLVSGDWRAVELSLLDTLISIIVAFIVNIAAVVIGMNVALSATDSTELGGKLADV